MKRSVTSIMLVILVIFSFLSTAFAENPSANTADKIIADIDQLLAIASPEERQQVLEYVLQMILTSSATNANNTGTEDDEHIDNTTSIWSSSSDNNTTNDEATSDTNTIDSVTVKFDDYDIRIDITGWRVGNYSSGEGYVFSYSVYNDSNSDYEIGIIDLKVNGWSLLERNRYYSLVRVKAGEKTRNTWGLSDLKEKADVNSLDEVEEIVITFFIGDYNGHGNEIATQSIVLTQETLDQLHHE